MICAAIAPKAPNATTLTLKEVIADLVPSWQRLPEWKNKERAAREIVQHFGADTLITAITMDRIERFKDFSLSQPIRVWTGARALDAYDPKNKKFWKTTGKTRSAASVNRRLVTLACRIFCTNMIETTA
jgi:hypothetical protein